MKRDAQDTPFQNIASQDILNTRWSKIKDKLCQIMLNQQHGRLKAKLIL